eukprot:4863778-Alexandrium_andersonii.AAC.1
MHMRPGMPRVRSAHEQPRALSSLTPGCAATASKYPRALLILRQDALKSLSLCCWALGARAASVAVAPQLAPTDYALVDDAAPTFAGRAP